jgi:beta-galactosidase beta subunit
MVSHLKLSYILNNINNKKWAVSIPGKIKVVAKGQNLASEETLIETTIDAMGDKTMTITITTDKVTLLEEYHKTYLNIATLIKRKNDNDVCIIL